MGVLSVAQQQAQVVWCDAFVPLTISSSLSLSSSSSLLSTKRTTSPIKQNTKWTASSTTTMQLKSKRVKSSLVVLSSSEEGEIERVDNPSSGIFDSFKRFDSLSVLLICNSIVLSSASVVGVSVTVTAMITILLLTVAVVVAPTVVGTTYSILGLDNRPIEERKKKNPSFGIVDSFKSFDSLSVLLIGNSIALSSASVTGVSITITAMITILLLTVAVVAAPTVVGTAYSIV